MRASFRVLQEAAAAAAARPAQAVRRDATRRSGSARTPSGAGAPASRTSNHLVIDVPFTALPSDVHRALKEVGAVPKDFPLSAIVRQPVGASRKASLTARYHLTVRNPSLAQETYNVLMSRPLFAAGSSRASVQPGRPAFGANGLKDDARVAFSAQNAAEWGAKMIASVQAWQPTDYQYAQQAALRTGGLPDAAWAMQPNTSGRRVLLRGLPRERPVNLVRDFIRDMGVEIEADGLKRLVPAQLSSRAAYAVTCKSVADAHYLARRLNMAPYLQSVLGYEYMMRAHVIW
ncbi:hypothetical protein CC85DRAFT_30 [Cutaneotrichosporon oleaginosum]|uniref:Uncharacterized protein n=1 Tax=Cutaneotrichosporon oleaginosum TaxID=879819 RepID=A0A0J0XZ26_9TREE|nr:uncharacterized protein CC85DRAFT_30 [Cutaneotrichosporon oleaginosum]KLT46318.1 hypothetical protein CC85DRAFT_30 [Cutaneotrichosporon oleaginosum]TXT15310.1 hypothetical protein COLE_01503 [Cutaneotrichosporon oleaginosum]